MKITKRNSLMAVALASILGTGSAFAAPALTFDLAWTATGTVSAPPGEDVAGTEIVAIDAASGRVFITYPGYPDQGIASGIEIRNLADGTLIGVTEAPQGWSVNSVAVKNGIVAVAAAAPNKTDPGQIAFFNTTDAPGSAPIDSISVGSLPDMVTFTPDGNKVLVANEGEPNDAYTIDPNGSVSIIDISGGVLGASVTNLDFTAFNGDEAAIEAAGGRIFGNNDTATVAQDLEPEYITVTPDGSTAFVTLQENNMVAKIDLATNAIELQGLGYKDHSLPGNELDASNQDGIDGNLQNWPVLGMYQPDAIDSYEFNGQMYYVTANEGDARDYDGYSEELRVRDLALDLNDDGVADAFSPLQDNDQLGRLKTTTANGDIDGDGLFEQVFSYGARSFSIWDDNGNLVFDSGNLIETIIANEFPAQWQEGRSDDKGPEPESIKLAQLGDWMYALVGLERTSGFMLFDVTDPNNPLYMDYIFNGIDIGPEGIDFSLMFAGDASTQAWGYLAVSHEVSNTVSVYKVSQVPLVPTAALLGLGLLALRLRKRR